MKEPQPSFEWIITDRCNYECSYCYQRHYADKRHCSDQTTDAVFALLLILQGTWLVKLIGGEPLIHPRFFEMCRAVTESGHRITTTTNLSLPLVKLQELVDICGDRLDCVTASLHLTQVRSVDSFIEKAAEFNARKHPATTFSVTSVLV